MGLELHREMLAPACWFGRPRVDCPRAWLILPQSWQTLPETGSKIAIYEMPLIHSGGVSDVSSDCLSSDRVLVCLGGGCPVCGPL